MHLKIEVLGGTRRNGRIKVGTGFNLTQTIIVRVEGRRIEFPPQSHGEVLQVILNGALRGTYLYRSRLIHPTNGAIAECNVPREYFVPAASTINDGECFGPTPAY